MSRRKSDQMRLPATRLLGSKLFGCCSRHRRAGASGAPATTRTHGARSPGVASNAVASSRGNSCIPRGTKPGPSSLLEIGFGPRERSGPLFAFFNIQDSSQEGSGPRPPDSGRGAGYPDQSGNLPDQGPSLGRPFAFSRPVGAAVRPAPEPPPSRANDPIPSLFRCEKARLGRPRPFD